MSEAVHRVMLFVFRQGPQGVEYLMVRREPEHEGFWSPLREVILPAETVQRAALRSASHTVHPPIPLELIDLHHFERFRIGDYACVEWALGYGVGSRSPRIALPSGCLDYRWARLEGAFRLVEEEAIRRAMMKLHLRIAAG
ncbi:MAG: hypothetical protein AB1486_15875 [Planctomycetota bacterium]